MSTNEADLLFEFIYENAVAAGHGRSDSGRRGALRAAGLRFAI